MAKQDLLSKAKKSAKTKEPKPKRTELRRVFLDDPEIVALIEVASLTDDLTPIYQQFKAKVQDKLFDRWTEEMWANKSKPENFKVVIQKKESGLDDGRCNFIFKVNRRGIAKLLPAEADLPKGKTIEEVLAEMICRQCGLTEDNAKQFVDGEIEITDEIALADSFDRMYYGNNKTQRKIAELILKYIEARPSGKSKNVSVEAFDDELAGEALVTQQTVLLKSDMPARVFKYCDSLEQLRSLLNFCDVTKQVSNFEFAVSDDSKQRHKRHCEIVDKYLIPE